MHFTKLISISFLFVLAVLLAGNFVIPYQPSHGNSATFDDCFSESCGLVQHLLHPTTLTEGVVLEKPIKIKKIFDEQGSAINVALLPDVPPPRI